MIITGEDLEALEKEGLLRIEHRGEFGPCSLNLTIDQLLKPDHPESFEGEAFLKCLKPVEAAVLSWGDFHYFRTREEIHSLADLLLEVTSRSGYARLGVRSVLSDEQVRPGMQYNGSPLIQLSSHGPRVAINDGASPCQLVFRIFEPELSVKYVKRLMRQGELEIARDGRPVPPSKLTFHGRLVLTMDERILVYRGSLLTPGALRPDDFEEVTLGGTWLKKGTFFLSASAENVSIGPKYAGRVTHGNSFETNTQFFNTRNPMMAPPPFLSHPNAPYIWPRNVFSGKITFENVMTRDSYVKAGMKQAELQIERLSSESTWQQPSRYDKQQSVQTSRL